MEVNYGGLLAVLSRPKREKYDEKRKDTFISESLCLIATLSLSLLFDFARESRDSKKGREKERERV